MEEHGLVGDQGVFIDRAQENYVTDIGYGTATYNLSKKVLRMVCHSYSCIGQQRGEHSLRDIKKDGLWAKSSFQNAEGQGPR
eukprot:4696998-Karenia_brevis.AAC.1